MTNEQVFVTGMILFVDGLALGLVIGRLWWGRF